jgi:hypothetical protein
VVQVPFERHLHLGFGEVAGVDKIPADGVQQVVRVGELASLSTARSSTAQRSIGLQPLRRTEACRRLLQAQEQQADRRRQWRLQQFVLGPWVEELDQRLDPRLQRRQDAHQVRIEFAGRHRQDR